MIIRTSTAPFSLRDVPAPAHHPSVYQGDGDNSVEFRFGITAFAGRCSKRHCTDRSSPCY